jgi:hypothetical protein
MPSFYKRVEYKSFAQSRRVLLGLAKAAQDVASENDPESDAIKVCKAFPSCDLDAEQVLCSCRTAQIWTHSSHGSSIHHAHVFATSEDELIESSRNSLAS